MKKIFLVAGVALLAACSDSTTSSETNVQGSSTTDTAMTTNNASVNPGANDTGMTTTSNGTGVAGTETSTTTTTTSTSSSQAYAPAEGDVTRRNGKVMVYRNNTWVSADRDMTGDNGVTITRTGTVTRDGKTVEIQEGETVNRSGSFWDKAGNAVSNAWDDTKHGVKKAGKAVGNAAEKVGSKVKDAVDKDHK